MVRRKTAKKNQDDLPPRRRRITPPPVVEKNAQTLSPALRKVILVLLTIFLLTLTIMATVVQVGGDTYRVSPSAKTMLPPLVHGLRTQQPAEKKLKHRQIAHITPIDPTQLPKLTCKGKTVVSIVAHQDDDILFMNPTHIHNLRAGDCLRTIYVTAGDDGNMQSDYWTRREYGSENAYSVMTNTNGATWTSQSVTLADHELVTVSNSLDNP
ncbi:MAG: hypothetical protein ABJA64_03410, partial [Candidatus Saccharibacteria bacterium]